VCGVGGGGGRGGGEGEYGGGGGGGTMGSCPEGSKDRTHMAVVLKKWY